MDSGQGLRAGRVDVDHRLRIQDEPAHRRGRLGNQPLDLLDGTWKRGEGLDREPLVHDEQIILEAVVEILRCHHQRGGDVLLKAGHHLAIQRIGDRLPVGLCLHAPVPHLDSGTRT